MNDLGDGDLISRVDAGDRTAFAVLVTRHHGRVHRLAARILNDGVQAEDVVQDAFLKLWTGRARYDGGRGSFMAWFNRIIVNQCLDARRSFKLVQPLDDAIDRADEAPTPEAAAQLSQRDRQVAAALAALPARQRAVLALFHAEGRTMAETAAVLDMSVKAVESLLSRGRAALRARLVPIKETA